MLVSVGDVGSYSFLYGILIIFYTLLYGLVVEVSELNARFSGCVRQHKPV